MIELLTLIPGFLELTGLYLLGKKNRYGFLFNIIAGILWIAYSIYTMTTFGLLIVCGTALYLNVKGYLNWK